MQDSSTPRSQYRLLHVIVGHKFLGYYENAISSVLAQTTGDDILVVDNASNELEITRRLNEIAASEPRVRLMLRTSNDLSRNTRVGGLYDAYNEVMTHVLDKEYDYVHILQHDMQMLWWDKSVVERAREIFEEYPECVNISTMSSSRHILLSDHPEFIKPKLMLLAKWGLTDTGLYDVAKWRDRKMRFYDSETEHSRKYLGEGLKVFSHPLPTVAQIPWPVVVRRGKVVGREVERRHEFLLRPLSPNEITRVKESTEPIWSEDICFPWGWTCLTPLWTTDLRSINYLVSIYRDARSRGLRAAWPRWDRGGLPARASLRGVQRRPRLGMLSVLIVPTWYSLRRAMNRS